MLSGSTITTAKLPPAKNNMNGTVHLLSVSCQPDADGRSILTTSNLWPVAETSFVGRIALASRGKNMVRWHCSKKHEDNSKRNRFSKCLTMVPMISCTFLAGRNKPPALRQQ